MTSILDHSAWAIRPQTLGAVKRLVRGDITRSDMRVLLEDPSAAEARIRRSEVTSDDIPKVGSVAVLSLTGIIQPNPSLLSLLLFGSSGGLQQFRAELRAAVDDDSVSAILLNVDSPGGSVSLVEETAAEVRAARERKPIIAVSNCLTASAAYWIASQATDLAVTPSGYVGSIGVYMLHDDWSGFNEQMGIDPTYVFAAPYKVEGNPDEPLSDEARADWQNDVDTIYGRFIADVAAGRSANGRIVSEETVRSDYGEGRVMGAQAALAAGMVDRVATFEEMLAELVANTTTAVPGDGAAADALRGLAASHAELADLQAQQTAAAEANNDALARQIAEAITAKQNDILQASLAASERLAEVPAPDPLPAPAPDPEPIPSPVDPPKDDDPLTAADEFDVLVG